MKGSDHGGSPRPDTRMQETASGLHDGDSKLIRQNKSEEDWTRKAAALSPSIDVELIYQIDVWKPRKGN